MVTPYRVFSSPDSELLELQYIVLNAEEEVGFYGGIDYLYLFDNMTLGLHLVVENSDNIVSKTGLSLGFFF